MLEQVENQTVTLTSTAAKAVQDILAQRNLSGYALRVFVAGQSCCGAQFGMALDNENQPGDQTFETDGVKLVVDAMSIDFLRGGTIDFITDPERGTGFLVTAPNAGKKEDGECSGGGCGGGCSCGN